MTKKIPGVFAEGDGVVVIENNGPLKKGWACTVSKVLSRAVVVKRGAESYLCSTASIQHENLVDKTEGVDSEHIESMCEGIAMIFSDHQKKGGSLHPYMVAALTLAALQPGTTDAERIALAKTFRETYEIMKRKEASHV